MKPLNKYFYIIPAALSLFGALWGIFGLGVSIFSSHDWCLIDLPNLTNGAMYFIGMLFRLVSPFISLYVGLTLIYLSGKPEKENILTKIGLWLVIFMAVVQVSGYIPFLGMFLQVLVYNNFFATIFFFIPLVSFLLLLVGGFNKYIFIICFGLVVLILGGVKFSENRHGCSAGLGNQNNNSKLESAIANNNENQCASLIYEQKQQCYSQIAINKNDAEICSDMDSTNKYSSISTEKNWCYYVVAKNTKNPQICNLMMNEIQTDGVQAKDNCLTDVTKLTGNLATCSLISNLRQKDICISNVAQMTKNLKTCNLATNSDLPFKDRCITSIASANKDIKICDLIANSNENRYCVDEVAIATNNCALVKKYGDAFYNGCLVMVKQNQTLNSTQ